MKLKILYAKNFNNDVFREKDPLLYLSFETDDEFFSTDANRIQDGECKWDNDIFYM